MLTLFSEKANELVSLKVDGKTKKMSRMEAWVTNLWNRAIALDPKASAIVVTIMRANGQLDPTPEDEVLDADSAAALDALISRLPKKPDGGSDDSDE